MANCWDKISDPTPIRVASTITKILILIRSKQDSWNVIGSRDRELARNYWSDHVTNSDRIILRIGHRISILALQICSKKSMLRSFLFKLHWYLYRLPLYHMERVKPVFYLVIGHAQHACQVRSSRSFKTLLPLVFRHTWTKGNGCVLQTMITIVLNITM